MQTSGEPQAAPNPAGFVLNAVAMYQDRGEPLIVRPLVSAHKPCLLGFTREYPASTFAFLLVQHLSVLEIRTCVRTKA